MKNIIILSALSILMASCEKVIDLKLNDDTPKLVVEAEITNNAAPYVVKLSKSVAFTQSSVYPEVANAQVIISDNAGTIDTLTYKGKGEYYTQKIQGVIGRTYNLNIVSEGNTYTATSTMPKQVPLDTLSVLKVEAAGQTRFAILPNYIDASEPGNFYQFVLNVNGKQVPDYILWNDNVSNGKPNQRPINSNAVQLVPGDTAMVQMRCYNASSYNYYYTLGSLQANGPGGGTTPTNPPTNISNGALGLFSAHTSQVKSIVIQ
jgi:hypothetical protein